MATKEDHVKGEKIYSYDVKVTGAADHGIALEDVLSGKAQVPPQGTRIDISFEGPITGRLNGKIHGVDYAMLRADGRVSLDIRATIETDDGHRIALSAGGVAVATPGSPTGDLAENISLNTPAESYTWVNTRQIWGVGTVDFAAGKVHIDAYMQ
jgi:hypothetical protein